MYSENGAHEREEDMTFEVEKVKKNKNQELRRGLSRRQQSRERKRDWRKHLVNRKGWEAEMWDNPE